MAAQLQIEQYTDIGVDREIRIQVENSIVNAGEDLCQRQLDEGCRRKAPGILEDFPEKPKSTTLCRIPLPAIHSAWVGSTSRRSVTITTSNSPASAPALANDGICDKQGLNNMLRSVHNMTAQRLLDILEVTRRGHYQPDKKIDARLTATEHPTLSGHAEVLASSPQFRTGAMSTTKLAAAGAKCQGSSLTGRAVRSAARGNAPCALFTLADSFLTIFRLRRT